MDEGHYALPEVTVQDMCVFLAIIVQMGYDLRDTEGLLVGIRTVIYGLLQKCYETSQVLSYT
jgi:hypothetical protein